MIKVLLKHLIYEICISVFFDAIKRNFSKVKFEFIGLFGRISFIAKAEKHMKDQSKFLSRLIQAREKSGISNTFTMPRVNKPFP